MVVISPSTMPKLSSTTFVIGARQFVVQDAFEMILSSFVKVPQFTPMTTVLQSPFAGAEMITFFAPAARCPAALSASVNSPVDSTTMSTPSAPHGSAVGPFLDREALDPVAVHNDHALALVGDRAVVAALRRVVFEQIRQIVRRHEIVDRHDFDVVAEKTLLRDCPEYQSADPAETIDAYFESHVVSVFWR